MQIGQLLSYDRDEYKDIKALMAALSEHNTLSESQLEDAIRQSHLYVLRDGKRIVGMATLCPYYSPSGSKGSIEDVVVLPEYQGCGLGRSLMQHVLKEAEQLGIARLYLTSRPQRIAANALYRSLGFIQKETNVYFLNIKKK